ncbi:MAG: Helix-turn-helix domain protein [Berkelbacteria bacterium GW2011_GWB1_38_5]|uniref:Helix-turn-helix domain protein n=1 Tax=Berkelbacteria bacterium GW2011_GWB1_38_5 TaxID=1618336 RepID=A0A0G0MF51_9BACT|nr:MAG: Helix-turn-helix domain protein [Berkelbacteria bacterium GW2011_GWB1_38_5]
MISKNKDKENIFKNLGGKLKRVREEAKLTQAEVAERAGIHVNYYARIERGEENPTYEKLESIKKALKIDSLDSL